MSVRGGKGQGEGERGTRLRGNKEILKENDHNHKIYTNDYGVPQGCMWVLGEGRGHREGE